MADDSKDSPSIELEGKVDATGASGRATLTAVDKLARVLRPGTYREQEAFDVMIEGVRRKQALGDPLSPLEATVLAATLEPVLRKAKNIRKVIEFALDEEPNLAQLASPMTPVLGPARGGAPEPLALPASSAPGASIEVDFEETVEQQEALYFWDRFWADAEVVTVEHIQRVYGKIAARKAVNRRAISLHTLDVIRCLEARTLANFEKLTPYAVIGGSVPSWSNFKAEYQRVGLRFDALLEFEEARLITMTDILMPFRQLNVGGGIIKVRDDDGETPGAFGEAMPQITGLTRAGEDLHRLKRNPLDQVQLAAILKYLAVYGGKRLEWSHDGKAPFEPIDEEVNMTARVRTAKPDNKDPLSLIQKSKT